MGPQVHPRLKKPIGQRLAASAMNLVYGGTGAVTGPTIAGCSLAGGKLSITFDKALLRGSKLIVQKYDTTHPNRSAFLALANTSATQQAWVPLNIALGAGNVIQVDLAPLKGATPVAIRYAWGGLHKPDGDDVRCCMKDVLDGSITNKQKSTCDPAMCPIFAAVAGAPFAGLPANPFLAKIVGGKCECPFPQVCGPTPPSPTPTPPAPAPAPPPPSPTLTPMGQ
jgi:hypothetical protein